jgi:purine-binding chemotaxis protein CheW
MQKIKAKTTKRTSIDWDTVRARIDETNQKLNQSDELDTEALEKAWARRAAQIAQKIEGEDQGETIQAAIVRMDGELYGLDVQHIFDIRPLEHVTFVPRVPAWVLGVINWRGRILSVIDLRRFLGLPENSGENNTKSTRRLLVLQAGEMEVGVQADEVFAIETIPINKINREDSARAIKAELVNGLFMRAEQQEIIVLLNLPVLLSDPHLIVREELL